MQIRMVVDWTPFTATPRRSETARDFGALLPLAPTLEARQTRPSSIRTTRFWQRAAQVCGGTGPINYSRVFQLPGGGWVTNILYVQNPVCRLKPKTSVRRGPG